MTKFRSLVARARSLVRRAHGRSYEVPDGRYDPSTYWERRSRELIETYDRPETWSRRGWLREGADEETVPSLLGQHECRSVLVIGAGSGRQYGFLRNFRVSGFDISPTLLSECRKRYPTVPTVIGQVIGCERLFDKHDAVLSSGVLMSVPPREIEDAINSVKASAIRLVVIREYTALESGSSYRWARDYVQLMNPWRVVYREVTDERDGQRAELIAFAPSGADDGAACDQLLLPRDEARSL